MSTPIYTREECKKLIEELGIIKKDKNPIRVSKTKITSELMESILFHTNKCRDNISERIFWIINDVEDYPICKQCGKQFQPRFYGFRTDSSNRRFCSPKCSSKNESVLEQTKQTCIQKYGVDHPWKSPIIREQIKQTNFENFGVEHQLQSPIIKEQIKQTNLKKYGVEHVLQSPVVREKSKQTWLKNLEVDHPWKSPIIQEQIKQTNLKNYGVEYPFQSPIIQEQIKQTNLKNYGVENAMQSLEIQEKVMQTNMINFGVPYLMQNKDIFLKQQKNAFRLKTLILPSGLEITYQGYENVAIIKLLENYSEEQIILGRDLIPTIKYKFENKSRVYHPDIYIPYENKIIEVKSVWTYEKELAKNLAKRQACLDQGYQFEFWICSDKELLEIM
jgi:hypothetical protein